MILTDVPLARHRREIPSTLKRFGNRQAMIVEPTTVTGKQFTIRVKMFFRHVADASLVWI